jgi:methylenetetrahydrofolate reductase (NADPH)
MRDEGVLMNGETIEGGFPMLIGAAANPGLKPIELNMIKLSKKVRAGADFIQTQAVFDPEEFQQWLKTAREAGITKKAAVIAGIMPLTDAAEAEKLRDTFTEFHIPDAVLDRLKKADGPDAQKREGLAICTEIIQKVKTMDGVRGIHILSGGKEDIISDLLTMAGF